MPVVSVDCDLIGHAVISESHGTSQLLTPGNHVMIF